MGLISMIKAKMAGDAYDEAEPAHGKDAE